MLPERRGQISIKLLTMQNVSRSPVGISGVESAAVFLQRAIDGKSPGAKVEAGGKWEPPFERRYQLVAFRLRQRYYSLFRFAVYCLIFVNVFERPEWTYEDNYCTTWDNSARFPSFSLPYFTINEALATIISLITLIIIFVAIALELVYRSSEYIEWDDVTEENERHGIDPGLAHGQAPGVRPSQMQILPPHRESSKTEEHSRLGSQITSSSFTWRKRRWRIVRFPHWPLTCIIICWCLALSQIIVYICSPKDIGPDGCDQVSAFATSPVEALFLIFIEKSYSTLIYQLSKSVPKFVSLVIFATAILSIYTALGLMLFRSDSTEGRKYFPDFPTALWNMFTVLIQSNWPSPMIPAYDESR